MNNSNEEKIYELLGQSPLAWLDQAEFLKMSATLILEKLIEIRNIGQAQPGIREQKLAFTQSFMLLMGMSFENLIKGVHIAKTPRLSIEDRIKIWNSYRGGHGISGLIKLVTSTSAKEKNLLRCCGLHYLGGRLAIGARPGPQSLILGEASSPH
jgi:hypothetical protein